MPRSPSPVRHRSTRASKGRTPKKYDPEAEASKPQWRTEEEDDVVDAEEAEAEADAAIEAEETDILDDDSDGDDDEEFSETDLPTPHPNIRFGLASRQNLQSAEVEDLMLDLKSVFVWQALIEGSAALALAIDSFPTGMDKVLVADSDTGDGAQMLRVTAALMGALAIGSGLLRHSAPAPERSAYCFGAIFYHVAIIAVYCHAYTSGATLLGSPLAGKISGFLPLTLSDDQLRLSMACTGAALHAAMAGLLLGKTTEDEDEVLVVWEDEDDEDEE